MTLTRLRSDCQVWSMFNNWVCTSRFALTALPTHRDTYIPVSPKDPSGTLEKVWWTMSGREALEAADNALLQDEHTSTHLTPTCLSPVASYAYTQSYSWFDFQVNILAMHVPSHPLLPSSPPPLKTLTCMPPSRVSHCWRYRWRVSVSLQPPCLGLPRYTADRGPHPRHSDGPALPPSLHQVTNVLHVPVQ